MITKTKQNKKGKARVHAEEEFHLIIGHFKEAFPEKMECGNFVLCFLWRDYFLEAKPVLSSIYASATLQLLRETTSLYSHYKLKGFLFNIS